jgi:hypothetical protein
MYIHIVNAMIRLLCYMTAVAMKLTGYLLSHYYNFSFCLTSTEPLPQRQK